MTTTNSFLIDSAARHTVFVQRFAGGQRNELLPFVDRVRRETSRRLREEDLTNISRRKLLALEADLTELTKSIYDEMGEQLTEEMKDFSVYEAGFSSRMFEKATDVSFTVPAPTVIEAAVLSKSMGIRPGKRGQTVAGVLAQFSDKKAKQIVQIVKDGAVAGRTTQEVVKDINTISGLQKAQVGSLVRTITNHVSSEAREITMRANKDIVKGVEWVSVLDSRTSASCRSLDGKIFPIGKGPRPPIHWACRSTVIPAVKDEFKIRPDDDKATRPAIDADGVTDEKSTTTYNSWIKRQSKSFQEEVMGPTRAKLLREGNLSMDKFVDENFQELSLDQLKRKEPAAFESAGI